MMNALNFKGIGNVYRIDVEGHAKQKGIPAQGDTRWSFLGSELGLPELDQRMGEILKRDDRYQRGQFQPFYEMSHLAIVKSGLRQNIISCRAAAGNAELRPEVRDGKIVVSASEGLGAVREALRPSYKTFRDRVSQCQRIFDAALQPTGDPVALELRGREVRDGLRRGDRGAATQALMRAASSGSLEAVYACTNDPLAGQIVPVEVLQQAQHVVLDAKGLGWVWKNLQDELDLLPEWAGRCDQLEMLLVSTLGGAPFSVKLSRQEGPSYFNLATQHVEALSGTTKPVITGLAA